MSSSSSSSGGSSGGSGSIIDAEVKRRKLTQFELEKVYQNLQERCNDESDTESRSLFDKICALVPPTAKEQKITLIEDAQQTQLLQPGESFSDYEVWANSGEHGAKDFVRYIRANGGAARLVPGSIMVIGDFWIVYKGALVLEIIERKAVPDFHASILDGRYVDQPVRMVASGAPFLFWMIVGSIQQMPMSEDRVRLASACSTLSHLYRDLKLEYVSEESLVGPALAKHMSSMRAYYEGTEYSERTPAVAKVARDCKVKELDTQENVWVVQLCVIRGMGKNRAYAVRKAYHSASAYIDACKAAGRRASLLLEKIDVPRLNGNGSQKLGKALSIRIYNCFFRQEEIPSA